MTTRPATKPEATPRAVGLPCFIHSTTAHAKAAAPAARWVLTSASAAFSFAASALPALNPNQPNQSMPAPSKVSVRL